MTLSVAERRLGHVPSTPRSGTSLQPTTDPVDGYDERRAGSMVWARGLRKS